MSKKYKIEKNIPIPKTQEWRKGRMVELFHKMEIGDSVLMATKNDYTTRLHNQLSANASVYGVRFGKKFVTRRTEDGLRLWRTE